MSGAHCCLPPTACPAYLPTDDRPLTPAHAKPRREAGRRHSLVYAQIRRTVPWLFRTSAAGLRGQTPYGFSKIILIIVTALCAEAVLCDRIAWFLARLDDDAVAAGQPVGQHRPDAGGRRTIQGACSSRASPNSREFRNLAISDLPPIDSACGACLIWRVDIPAAGSPGRVPLGELGMGGACLVHVSC